MVPVSARGQIQLCARRHALLLLLPLPLLLHLASSSITAEDEMLKLTGLPFPQSRAHWLFSSFSDSGPLRTLSLSRRGLCPLLRCVSGVLSFWALLVCSVTPFSSAVTSFLSFFLSLFLRLPLFPFHLLLTQEENGDREQGRHSSARSLLKFGHFSGTVQRVPEH